MTETPQASRSDPEFDRLRLRIKKDLEEFNEFVADLEACKYLERMTEWKKQAI